MSLFNYYFFINVMECFVSSLQLTGLPFLVHFHAKKQWQFFYLCFKNSIIFLLISFKQELDHAL